VSAQIVGSKVHVDLKMNWATLQSTLLCAKGIPCTTAVTSGRSATLQYSSSLLVARR